MCEVEPRTLCKQLGRLGLVRLHPVRTFVW